MNENLPGIEEATQLATTDEPQAKLSAKEIALLAAAGCFVIGFTLAYLQNTRKPAQDVAMLFDSGAYIMSCKYVLTAAHNFANGMPFETAIKSISETLMLNGPILPGLGAAFFALTGREPSLIDLRAPIVFQAIIHGIGAAVLALDGWRFTGRRAIGLSAGIVLAVWPSAIIGAGRFLTETITILLVGVILLCASYLPKARINGKLIVSGLAAFFFGSSVALLALVKAALAPGAVLALLAVFTIILLSRVDRRSFVTSLVAAALGFCLAFTPWLIFTKLATGEFALTAKRLPTYNIAAGLNPETDGLSALPETPLVKMFSESDGTGAVAYAIYNLNPGDFWGRMARKPLRLFQFPWNDCRLDFLGIPLGVQVFAHQILTVFGLFGLLAFISLPLSKTFAPESAAQLETDAHKAIGETSGGSSADTEAQISKQPHPELLPATNGRGKDAKTDLTTATPSLLSTLVVGLAALAIICGHAAYLPFVADSRYGFTALPSLILFALWCLSGQLKQRISKLAIFRLSIAAVFIMIAFTLKEDVWRGLFATSTEAMIASTLSLGALLLFIGCLLTVRTLLGSGKSNTTAKVLALVCTYFLLTLSLAAGMAGKECPWDWEARLSDKEEFVRIIDLPDSIDSSEQAFVLVNLKGDWRGARLKVNEKLIDAAPLSLLQLSSSPDLSNDYRTFGYILRTETDGIDQWRAFAIQPGSLRPGAQNTIALFAEKGMSGSARLTGSTTYGDKTKKPNSTFISAPSVNIFSPTNLCRSPFAMEPRLKERMPQSVARATSVRKTNGSVNKDLSSEMGTQSGQYHMFLLAGQAMDGKENARASGSTSDYHPIYVSISQNPSTERRSKVRRGAKLEESSTTFTGVAKLPATVLQERFVRITLTGEVDCASSIDASMHLNDLRLMQAAESLACHPARIPGTGKRQFRTEAIARSHVIDRDSAVAMIKISSDLVPLSVSNLRLELKPLAAPELSLSRKSWY